MYALMVATNPSSSEPPRSRMAARTAAARSAGIGTSNSPLSDAAIWRIACAFEPSS